MTKTFFLMKNKYHQIMSKSRWLHAKLHYTKSHSHTYTHTWTLSSALRITVVAASNMSGILLKCAILAFGGNIQIEAEMLSVKWRQPGNSFVPRCVEFPFNFLLVFSSSALFALRFSVLCCVFDFVVFASGQWRAETPTVWQRRGKFCQKYF